MSPFLRAFLRPLSDRARYSAWFGKVRICQSATRLPISRMAFWFNSSAVDGVEMIVRVMRVVRNFLSMGLNFEC